MGFFICVDCALKGHKRSGKGRDESRPYKIVGAAFMTPEEDER